MSKQLREGIEKAKQYYISRIIQLDFYRDSAHELEHLLISELQEILKKEKTLNKH